MVEFDRLPGFVRVKLLPKTTHAHAADAKFAYRYSFVPLAWRAESRAQQDGQSSIDRVTVNYIPCARIPEEKKTWRMIALEMTCAWGR